MKKIRINKTASMIAGFACAGIGCLVSIVTIASLSIVENHSNNIYFANYESYMNDDLIESLETENNVKYKTYGTSEQLEASFAENYDVAIPTTYSAVKMIKKNQLKPLDWSLFKIPGVSNATDALSLFIQPVQDILQSYDFTGDGVNDNLLEYGVPYFAQEIVFGYKKDCSLKLDLPQSPTTTWNQILSKLQTFTDIRNGSIVTLNDPRTMYGVANLYHEQDNINPGTDVSIKDFHAKYDFLADYKDWMIFRSDSGEIINNLADKNGNDYSIMYNGDLIYAIQGGDNNYQNGADIEYIKPDQTVIALDMMVVNKNTKVSNEDISNVIAKVGLNQTSDWTLSNFEYIQYTPPLKSIFDDVTQLDFWTSPTDSEKVSWSNEQANKFIELLTISNSNIQHLVEQPIDDFTKSNMEIAFNEAIGSLW